MKSGSLKLAALAAFMGVVAIGGWFLVTRAQRAPGTAGGTGGSTALDAHRTLGAPSVYKNLAVFPVYDASATETNAYTTLDEGLKAQQVKVQESKDGGDVNTLYVTNSGNKPLYLMGGEVVLGGQQDRCLAADTIVQPGKGNVPVTVFCVEHGRWSGRSEFGQSAPAVAGLSIRASAMKGEFDATTSRIAMAAPGGAAASPAAFGRTDRSVGVQLFSAADSVSSAQQQVWAGVETKNRAFKIQNTTGTYRDALNMTGGDTQKSIPAYVQALSQPISDGPHVVGVVAAVNGSVIAADIFSDPALFRKLWPKLLKSYAADAVEQVNEPGGKAAISARQVKEFMAASKDERAKQTNISGGGRSSRYDSAQASVYSLVDRHNAPAASAPSPVHESTLRK